MLHPKIATLAGLLMLALAGNAIAAPASSAEPDTSRDAPGAGISLGATRVIYNEKAGGAAIRVINTSSIPFLVQTWVDAYTGEGGWEKATPLAANTFVATPPLFRLDKGENSVRLQRATGDMPKDRESVFMLNVKTIPAAAKPKPGTNYVQFAFINAVKLFWRPEGLPGDANEAHKKLAFKRNGTRIEAVNPTPYHITVKTLTVGGVAVKDADMRMVPPLSTQSWPLPPGASGKVEYTTLNDYGALTPAITTNF